MIWPTNDHLKFHSNQIDHLQLRWSFIFHGWGHWVHCLVLCYDFKVYIGDISRSFFVKLLYSVSSLLKNWTKKNTDDGSEIEIRAKTFSFQVLLCITCIIDQCNNTLHILLTNFALHALLTNVIIHYIYYWLSKRTFAVYPRGEFGVSDKIRHTIIWGGLNEEFHKKSHLNWI